MGSRDGTPMSEAGSLTLNVWAPAAAVSDSRKRPILVWLHGGGFTSGSAGWDWYDGARLAEAGDIVVVTANYRLHALGFLWFPEIGADNLGLQDQAAALRWVHGNIAAFGGDRERLTIGGQSAGAYSALALSCDPATQHLGRRIMLQSTPFGIRPADPSVARRTTTTLLKLLGLPPDERAAPMLRSVPVDELLSAYGELTAIGPSGQVAPPMYPVRDGAGMHFAWHAAAARALRKDVLVGRTAHESTAFLAGGGTPLPDGAPDGPRWRAATAAVFGDGLDAFTGALTAAGGSPHEYCFDRINPERPDLGATHCADLPFVFDNLDAYAGAPMLGRVRGADRALAVSWSTAVGDFVRTGHVQFR